MANHGDSTTQVPPVTPPLAEQQQSGTTGIFAPVSTQQQQASSTTDAATMAKHFEDRIRALMSDKDKKDNELRLAIAAQVKMQEQLTALQEQSQSALSGAAQTTQSAIDQANLLATKIKQLEAENTRNNLLLDNPDIGPYAKFISPSSDAEQVKKQIEELREINKKQLAQLSPQPTVQQQQALPAGLLDLYAGRPGMAPILPTPGSTPAQMQPLSAADVETQNQAIDAMLKEAQESGDPEVFRQALEKAKKQAELMIKSVVG